MMSFRFRFLQNSTFLEMCPLMLGLFLPSVSRFEVGFLCLEVSCYKLLIMEGMMLFYTSV